MRAVDILRKKRDGLPLADAEIEAFVHGVTSGEWPDYQTSAMLMAILLRGMNVDETACLTRAMVHSGEKLNWDDLPGPKVDKHSTGGVGDKTSLILAPLAAACGCVVPMMSGRGLGHSGGTLDKLEAIPGFNVHLDVAEIRQVLTRVGCVMIGQTRQVAPADKKLYALRDVTATVESIPLITASILSKKIAEGIDALVMDVKCGQGAFMKTRADARALADSIVSTGNANGVRTEAFITAMDVPLGAMIGNALEVREAIDTLRGHGPKDLEILSLILASRMVSLGGLASHTEAERKVKDALDSGRGLEVFRKMIAAQGGDPLVVDDVKRLAVAEKQMVVPAARSGFLGGIDAERVGIATMLLGAGRVQVGEIVDPTVGARMLARRGDQIKAGDGLIELYYRDADRLGAALEVLKVAFRIDDAKPHEAELVLECVT